MTLTSSDGRSLKNGQSLLDHWRSAIRRGAAPEWLAFSTNLPAKIIPWMNIVDLHARDHMVVRSMGGSVVQMWGSDLTGVEIVATYGKDNADLLYGDFFELPTRPCGLLDHKNSVSQAGVWFDFHRLALPLARESGKPDRIVIVHDLHPTRDAANAARQTLLISNTSKRDWLDLGHGVPDRPPTEQVKTKRSLRLTREGIEDLPMPKKEDY